MSSPWRREQKRAEREAQLISELAECNRKAGLSMYMRILESDASNDVKEILNMMADKLGME